MISAIVPTLRGEARLQRYLPTVFAALEASGDTWEVIVVDDGAGLDPGHVPVPARVLALAQQGGYGHAVNAGAEGARGDTLLILNDDIRLEPDCVRLLRPYLAPDVFAVVPAIRSRFAACGDEAGKRGAYRHGWLELWESPSQVPQAALYAVGCCVLCRRARFVELGGFDAIYAPFFWEDVELSYRAWRRGLAVLHVPAAVCHHEGSATIEEAHTIAERERTSFRNRVLFHLRNLNDPDLRAALFGSLAAIALFERLPERRAGLADALIRYRGEGPRREPGLGDAEILRRVEEVSMRLQG